MDPNLLAMAAIVGMVPAFARLAVASLPGELLGAFVDRVLCSGWKSLRNRMRAEGPKVNQDLQRALRQAYLFATREMLEQSVPFARAGGLTDERGILTRAIESVSAELKSINTWMPKSEVLPDVPALMLTGESAANRIAAIRDAAGRSLESDLSRWAKGTWELDAVAQCWRDGWTSAGAARSWMGALSVYFHEALERDRKVANIFQATMLAELAPLIESLKTSMDEIPARVVDEFERRLGLRPSGAIQLLPPAPQRFAGRSDHLAWIQTKMVPGGRALLYGEPGNGKSTIAERAAWELGSSFEDVVYQNCGDRSVEQIAGDLLRRLSVDLSAMPPENFPGHVRARFAGRRILLVLDDVWRADAAALLLGEPASVLVTSRQPGVFEFAAQDLRRVDGFSLPEVKSFLRLALDARYASQLDELAAFAMEMEGHPYALTAAVGMLNRTTRPARDAVPFLKNSALRHGRLDLAGLLESAVALQSAPAQLMLRAFAVCLPSGAWLEFAANVAGIGLLDARNSVDGLVASSLLRIVDIENQVFGIHALLRKHISGAGSDEFRRRHAEVVCDWMSRWDPEWTRCVRVIDEADGALQFLDAENSETQFAALAHQIFDLGLRTGRLGAAYVAMETGIRRWERLGDRAGLQASWGNQALILKEWGRLEEAMTLVKKQEAACEELGDRAGLRRNWGNQASILQAWGRLEEAMTLLKKQEAVCEELEDRAGLQASWGNQALILQDWGRLEEAMALHRKKEVVCEELGDRAGLQASWGNQAIILQDWGRLEEAMALHQKEELICMELGDRAGFQRSWGNQALILQDWGRLEEAMALLEKQEAVCEELGHRAGLQASWGNQALILRAWGRLEEAMALLKKQAAVCEELGDRAGLHRSWGNQALILRVWGRLEEAMALHRKEEAVCEELGNRAGLGISLANQASIHKLRGEINLWRRNLEKARRLFAGVGMAPELARVEALLREE